MKGEIEINVTLPIDENTTFSIKILTEGKAKEMVLKALEDVREKIDLRTKAFANAFEESTYPPTRDTYADKMNECHEIIKIIDRKIKEIEHEASN